MTKSDDAIEASCHCGAITITMPRAPDVVVDCNCSLCRRYGVLWAYFDDSELQGLPQPGETHTYAWNGKHVDFHRCTTCGCVTPHWAPRTRGRTQHGLNARLLPPDVLAKAQIRHKDGAGSGKYLD